MKPKIIEITKENLATIRYEDVVAMTIAEGGAMGEANGFYVAMKNYDLYHTNFGNSQVTQEQLYETFPLLKTFNCFFGEAGGLNGEWEYFNMGFGNYLIVRQEYYDVIKNYIKDNLPDDYQHGPLYRNWYNIIKKTVK